ncbi:amino acid adenylation domain-containing protein [Streptomyces sp. NPDC046805]|uniref:amino acid adenylation domain-containing protein n=1 Tax=Streptomyces sp. NPDC046805 TaxID=3155134 RepID=UPI0033E988A0
MGAVLTAESVHERFDRQAARAADAIALVADDERVPYGDLKACADHLAAHLRSAGVRPGDLVGVCLERGVDMVVTLLAVLKSGAGYAMLDPGLPLARLRAMVADMGATTVAHTARHADIAARLGEGVRLVPVDGQPTAADSTEIRATWDGAPCPARPDGIACVMFTSGSTGRPKGIAAPHHALTATLVGQDYAGFGPGSVWLQCAPVSWDAFALELWGPLLNGGTCVLHPGMRPDPLVLRRLVARHGITDLYLSAGLFNVVVDEVPGALDGVRRVIVGGEALSVPHVAAALRDYPGLRLRNGYGPVEGMIFLTTHSADPAEAAAPGTRSVPIGRPLAHKTVHVLDARLRPVPDGAVGELYAAGAGLAHGYTGRPGATAERFVANPYGRPGERMYRTGDLVRRRADGALEFVGRADDQVKVRGFRVEPAEAEAVLARHPGVERVAVTARAGHEGELRLVAYVVPRGGEQAPDSAQLRAHARHTMPDFMVPAVFVLLDALPLLPNGKLDRAALPDPTPPPGDDVPPADADEPRTPVEKALCTLFAEALGRPQVGLHDDLFALGGNSLTVARILSRIHADLGAEIGVRTLFEAPTVAGIAAHLRDAATGPAPSPAAPRPDVLPLSFAQRRLWFLDRTGASVAYNVPLLARISGEVDAERLEAAMAAVAERHEALRTVFPQDDEGEPTQRPLDGPEARPRLRRARVAEAEFEERVVEAARHRFDLATEPPWHAVLFSIDDRPGEHALLVVMHHIATDGWSLAPLFADLSRAYAGEQLPPLPLQYADHALRQPQRLGEPGDPGSRVARQLAYWRQQLSGLPAAPALPRRPGHTASGAGARAATTVRRLDAAAHARLAGLGRAHDATLFMVLHAALAAVLDRAAPGADIAIGAPVAGRGGDPAADALVGFFVNLLVLRAGPLDDPTVGELLARTRACDLAAYAHQDVPFELVVDELNPPRLPGHHPFTDVVLALQNNASAALDLPGAESSVEVVRTGSARFQLLVDVTDTYEADGTPAGLTVTLEHQRDAFDTAVTDWLADAFTALLTALPADPDAKVSDLPSPEPPYRSAPEPAAPAPERPATPAADEVVRRIAAVWEEVLDVRRVGPHDDFFDLGGNSLRAVRVAARLATRETLPVTTAQILEHPTPAALAAELARHPRGRGADTAHDAPIPRRRRIPRPHKKGTAPWS